jgi:hypothetical protein
MNNEAEQEFARVLAVQGALMNNTLLSADAAATKADSAIGAAEALLGKLGKALPERSEAELTPFLAEPPKLRSWQEIADEARDEQPGEFSFAGIVAPVEGIAAGSTLSRWNAEFAGLHRLTRYDYAVAGAAGLFAGLIDVFLVQIPKHPGFLGGAGAEGGWLSYQTSSRSGLPTFCQPPQSEVWSATFQFRSMHPQVADWSSLLKGLDRGLIG